MATNTTTEEWVASLPRSQLDKYTYADAVFSGVDNKLEITCPSHGNFLQTAYSHKKGAGCPHCSNSRRGQSQKDTKESFVEKTLSVPKIAGKYSYTEVVYKNSLTHVTVVCPKHGPFQVSPANHLSGKGCRLCYDERRYLNNIKDNTQFIADAVAYHKDTYSYHLVEYVHCKKKVSIVCRKHGVFQMTPDNHLQGQGCPECKKCGYNVGKSGHLYVLSDGYVTKVGITNRKPTDRAKEILKSSGPSLQVESSYYFADGAIPQRLESHVHEYLRTNYQQVTEVFDGSTECFYDVDLQALTAFIVPLAAPSETNNRPNIN